VVKSPVKLEELYFLDGMREEEIWQEGYNILFSSIKYIECVNKIYYFRVSISLEMVQTTSGTLTHICRQLNSIPIIPIVGQGV